MLWEPALLDAGCFGPIFDLFFAGTIRFVGPDAACRSLLGLSPSAVVAETIARLTFQSDQDSFEKALNRGLRLQQARDLTL
jgi:hypothetical protein